MNADIALFSVVIIHIGKDCTLVLPLHVKLQSFGPLKQKRSVNKGHVNFHKVIALDLRISLF